jgi:hypothetical protein
VFARALGPLAILACTLVFAGDAGALTIDLADIVGGGDGTGTGGDAGVDVTDGSTTTTHAGPIDAPTNTFVPAANPLIDGVVIPDGGPGGSAAVPISSTGLTATGISDSTELVSHTWDHVWNGTNLGTTTNWVGAVLGMYANKGVTFDLAAITAAHGGLVPDSFDATPITGTSAAAQVDFYAFADGVLIASASLAGEDQFAPGFESPIPFDARFLTLVTSSDGLNSGDWSAFLNPTLKLVPPLTLGQKDTFDDDLDGWDRGHHEYEQDNGFLQIPGPEGAYMITFFDGAPWGGNYPAAGVVRLRMRLRNEGPTALSVFVVFGNTHAPSQGGEWLSTATPVSLSPGGGWGTYDIPIGPGNLVSVQGGATYESVMTNVRTVRILHNDVPDPRALIVNSVLDIDDVEALPEPASATALAAGSLLLRALARRRRA